jgi:hypothetical protein
MPIWLRKFTFNRIKDHYQEQNPPENDKSWTSGQARNIAKEERKTIKPPSYITKASKK